VVFPELEGVDAYDEVGQTLDLIESLQPRTIIPGHGRVFEDVAGALARARSRLAQFVAAPDKHTRHAVKVLVKFKLLELQRVPLAQLCDWAQATPYLSNLHARSSQAPFDGWLLGLFDELVRAGAAARDGKLALNVG
jgi:hypothetical protein